jgi:hypothetical protein
MFRHGHNKTSHATISPLFRQMWVNALCPGEPPVTAINTTNTTNTTNTGVPPVRRDMCVEAKETQ